MTTNDDQYVPSEDEMRHAYWLTRMLDHHAAVDAAFDRFLARVKRDAAREALDGFGAEWDGLDLRHPREAALDYADHNYPRGDTVTTRTPYLIARDTIDAMLADPDSASTVRTFMVELMEDALRLSMTPEWDLEDNCSVTEHVVSTLAPSLSNITRDEVRRAADQFGLELEYLDDPYRGIALEEED